MTSTGTVQPPRGRRHYGWVAVFAGAVGLFSCFGLARYWYSMLLPGMQAGLGLTYMGFIGTGSFIGCIIHRRRCGSRPSAPEEAGGPAGATLIRTGVCRCRISSGIPMTRGS